MKQITISALFPVVCLAVLSQGQAASLARYPFLPGSPMKQMEEGAGHVFAVAGSWPSYSVDKGGDYLYRWRPDSADWKLIRRVAPANIQTFEGPILYRGAVGSRAFFNLEDSKAYYTDDGGDAWTQCGGRPLQSNVIEFAGKLFAVSGDSLRSSTDSGASWTTRVSRLKASQLLAAGNLLYARGEIIQVSPDSGKTWATRVAGLKMNIVSRYDAYGLFAYGAQIICATSQGVYGQLPGDTSWLPYGGGSPSIQRVFRLGDGMYGLGGFSLMRFDPATAVWEGFEAWGSNSPISSTSITNDLSGMLWKDSRWWVSTGSGIAAYDTAARDYAWIDRGVHAKDPSPILAISGTLVSSVRNQLVATPADGAPKVIRDFRKPGKSWGYGSLVNAEPADSVLWVMGDSLLFRLRFEGGQARWEDSLPMLPADYGRLFCRGMDLLAFSNGQDPVTHALRDSAAIYVSRNGGKEFPALSRKIPSRLGYPDEVAGGFIESDTAWLWTRNADVHAFDLKTGEYRFFVTGIPAPSGPTSTTTQFIRTPAGMLMVQGSLFMLSRDGMRNWTLANKGLPTSLSAHTPIQKLNGRLYFSSLNLLYYSEDSQMDWKAVDMTPLSASAYRAASSVVAPEGVYVTRAAEDVVLVPWSDLAPLQVRRRSEASNPARETGKLRIRGSGLFIRSADSDFNLQGRRIPAPD